MDDLTRRLQLVTESLLDNETLTADLETEAAQELLNWGIACAEMIVRSTVGLGDSEADNVIHPRLKAMRRLMRRVNKWFAKRQEMGEAAPPLPLAKLLEQAAIIYGEDVEWLDLTRLDIRQVLDLVDDPPQFILKLRQFIEAFNLGTEGVLAHDHQENDTQEINNEEINNEEIDDEAIDSEEIDRQDSDFW